MGNEKNTERVQKRDIKSWRIKGIF